MSLAALGCNPSLVSTSAELALGTLGYSNDGGLYVYLQAAADLSIGAACVIQGNWQGVEITTTNGTEAARIGIVQVAVDDDEYGWGLVYGSGNLLVNASCAASVQLYTTATGGQLDDTATAIHITGAQLTTARGSGAGIAPVAVQWPSVDLIA